MTRWLVVALLLGGAVFTADLIRTGLRDGIFTYWVANERHRIAREEDPSRFRFGIGAFSVSTVVMAATAIHLIING